jgi:hypothetical protein
LCRYVMERVPWLHRVVIVEGPIDEGNTMALPTYQSSGGARTWGDRCVRSMMDLQTIHGCIVHRVQTLTGLASLLVSMTHALQNEVDAKGLTRALAMTVDGQAVTVEDFNKVCRVVRDELTMADVFKLQLSVMPGLSVRSCSAITETFGSMASLHEFLVQFPTDDDAEFALLRKVQAERAVTIIRSAAQRLIALHRGEIYAQDDAFAGRGTGADVVVEAVD